MGHYELVIKSRFAAAHHLREYHGNCENLHGHNWHLDIILQSNEVNSLGMAIDFRDAKRILNGILEQLDHKYLNELDCFRETNPTTENIAKYIYEELKRMLPSPVAVKKVTAWESHDCGASYSEV